MADGRHIGNHFLAIIRLHGVRLIRNFKFGGTIARTRKIGDENVQFRKSNTADGRHFENHYISISQPRIVQIARNLVRRHKFTPCDGNDKKSEIRKFKMVDGRRIGNHFLAITQPPVVPLRIKFGVRRQNHTHTKQVRSNHSNA